MADLISELDDRKSRRALSYKSISPDIVERLAAAATSSASCFNNQPWRFMFVSQDPALSLVKRHLSGGNYWGDRAPLIVLVVTDPDWDCRLDADRDYALFDTGMATGYLILQAVREGLVAHPIAGYKAPELKEALGIAPSHILVTLVIVGYPGDEEHLTDKHKAAEASPRRRKPMREVVFHNEWPMDSNDASGGD